MSSEKTSYTVIKHIFDYGFALTSCLVLAIPIALACACICLDSPGLPLIRQQRVGKSGKSFGMWKLRTMYIDAEQNIDIYFTAEQKAQWDLEHKVDNDPRITKVGSFLRKTSIDEIPQLLNVLGGQMSIVGPRPVTLEEITYFGEQRNEIVSILPGITGYWQAFARNDATWNGGERQRMELYYVQHRSLFFDIRILLHTFTALTNMTGR